MRTNLKLTLAATVFLTALPTATLQAKTDLGEFSRFLISPNEASVAKKMEKISGIVRDAMTGEPLIGASILVKGSSIGTTTDIDGRFMLDVPAGSTIRISYVGYTGFEGKASSNMQVELASSTNELEDMVVVGYGVQKKASITGAVSTVKGSDLKTSGVANITNTFAGQIPGVVAKTTSGEPGSDWSDIYIRGKGTLNDNSPLIIIDGVANRSGLERLNPNDIESINVLKDASAAIYGAEAANGVILVTTKRGKTHKPTITYNGSFSLQQNTRQPDLMNAYQNMVWSDEISIYKGQTPQFENIKGGYLDGTIDRLQYGDTDWMDVVFNKATPSTRHSIALSGGSDRAHYYVSGDYTYQKPNYKNTKLNFQTYQIRSNIDAYIFKDLKIGVDIAARREQRNNAITSTSSIFWEAMMAYPWLYDFYPNGLPGPGISGGNNLALLIDGETTGYNRIKDTFLDTKFSFDLQMPWITQGLSLSGYVAIDYHARDQKKMFNVWDTYTYNPISKEYDKRTTNTNGGVIDLNQNHDDNSRTTMMFKLGYDRDFGDHHVGVFVAYEQSKYSGEYFSAFRKNFLTAFPDYLNFGADQDKSNGGYGYHESRQNIFGRLNYSYMDRYLVEFTLRRDGSMKFAPGKRWGTFPGVSVGWRFGQEKFIRDNTDIVDDLKLRASWGKLGNDRVSSYQYLSTYSMSNGAILGVNPELNKGFAPGRIGNANITWEKVDTKNIGIDGSLWNGMLGFTAEYFYQKRKDILTPKNASVPDYTGLTLPDQNIGEVSNQGFELLLSHRNRIGNVSYNASFNFTYTHNKIIYFDEAETVPEWQRRTGKSIDTYLMYKSDGIYQTWDEVNSTPHLAGAQPGDIKYLDLDGDEKITSDDKYRNDYGTVPRIVFGLNYGAEWKGIGINMTWTGQAKARQMIVPYSYNLDKTFFENRWVSAEQTPNSKYPRAFNKDGDNNTQWSDFWCYDSSFLRLKNLEVFYNLPETLVARLGLQNFRVFFSGTNLFVLDHIKVQDPELNATSTGQAYSPQRVFTFGINLGF
ncbi:MAG: TonB-dependent receptor [Muribaculaceae bacterium]